MQLTASATKLILVLCDAKTVGQRDSIENHDDPVQVGLSVRLHSYGFSDHHRTQGGHESEGERRRSTRREHRVGYSPDFEHVVNVAVEPTGYVV